MAIENHWSETDAVLMASVGRVAESPLECLVLRQFQGGRRQRVGVLGRGDQKVQCFRDRVFPAGDQRIGGADLAGVLGGVHAASGRLPSVLHIVDVLGIF